MPVYELEDDMENEIDYAESLHSDTTGDEDVMSDVSDDITPKPGSGMANVMAKLLGKKASSKTGPILCKAKTERELQARKKRKTNDISVVPIDGSDTSVVVPTSPDLKMEEDDMPDVKTLTHIEQQMKKRRWEEMGLVLPNVNEFQKEKRLKRIATSGVVAWFNAVKKRQEKDTSTKSSSISKTKGQFLDMLHLPVSSKQSLEVKSEVKDEEETWNILRADFLGDAPMQDWDKVTDV